MGLNSDINVFIQRSNIYITFTSILLTEFSDPVLSVNCKMFPQTLELVLMCAQLFTTVTACQISIR